MSLGVKVGQSLFNYLIKQFLNLDCLQTVVERVQQDYKNLDILILLVINYIIKAQYMITQVRTKKSLNIEH